MTSNDNQILTLILNQLSDMKRDNASYYERMERQISEMRRENAEFRREMKQEMQDFKAEIKQDIQAFKAEIKEDIQSFKAETKTRFDRLETQTAVIQNDITGLKHDVSNLFTWNYWTLSIILALVVMPHIVAGVKSLIQALSEGISIIVGAFKGNKREK